MQISIITVLALVSSSVALAIPQQGNNGEVVKRQDRDLPVETAVMTDRDGNVVEFDASAVDLANG